MSAKHEDASALQLQRQLYHHQQQVGVSSRRVVIPSIVVAGGEWEGKSLLRRRRLFGKTRFGRFIDLFSSTAWNLVWWQLPNSTYTTAACPWGGRAGVGLSTHAG